jgi:hypothetical protein
MKLKLIVACLPIVILASACGSSDTNNQAAVAAQNVNCNGSQVGYNGQCYTPTYGYPTNYGGYSTPNPVQVSIPQGAYCSGNQYQCWANGNRTWYYSGNSLYFY